MDESLFVETYQIGQVFPEFITGTNTIRMKYKGDAWELGVAFPEITNSEISSLLYGDISSAITVIDGLLFFLFRIGQNFWWDTPYEPRFLSAPSYYRENYESGTGAPLILLIMDSTTGELKKMRMVGLGTSLTIRLHSICNLLDIRRPIDKAAYDKQLAAIYKKYASSEDMLKTVKPTDIFVLVNRQDIS